MSERMKCAKCHRPIRNAVLIAGAVYGSKCAKTIVEPNIIVEPIWEPPRYTRIVPWSPMIEEPPASASRWYRFKGWLLDVLSAWKEPEIHL